MHVVNDAFNCYVHWVTFHVNNCNWFISCLWMQIHTYDIGLHSQWWAVLWKLSHWIPIILQIIPRQVTLSSYCQSFFPWIFDDTNHIYTRRKYILVDQIFGCICQIPCLDTRSSFPKCQLSIRGGGGHHQFLYLRLLQGTHNFYWCLLCKCFTFLLEWCFVISKEICQHVRLSKHWSFP